MQPSATAANANNEKRAKRRRTTYFISPSFQWGYVLRAALTVFVAANMMAIVLYGVLFEQARSRMLAVPAADTWQNTRTMVVFALTFSMLLATMVGLWCVVLTHRVMGPLQVMQQGFQELQRGKLPHCRPLRKRDEFKDLYQDYCTAIEALRRQQEANQAALQSAMEIYNTLQQGEVESQLDEQVLKVQQMCQALAEKLEPATDNNVDIEEVDTPAV
jgi:hypothetical protein